MQYYIMLNGRQIGPMTADQLASYPVNTDTPVSRDGGDWQPLIAYPELMTLINRGGAAVSPIESKRILCGVMAIVLGGLGIQYFIMGKTAGGFLTILLTLVTCGLWEIVVFIQGIMMLCMSDSEFMTKYVNSPKTLPLF